MERRDYRWSSIFAWGLTLSGAALATGGVIGMFWPHLNISWLCVAAFAGMMAFGIGLVNCSAAGALHALKHRKTDGRQVDWAILAPALACCLGFVFATNIGVHMGWEIVKVNAPDGARLPQNATVDIVFYIFAFAKPAMAWIVEGRKSMDAEVEAARITQRRKEAAELAAAESATSRKTKKAPAIRAAAKRAAETQEKVEKDSVEAVTASEIERVREMMAKASALKESAKGAKTSEAPAPRAQAKRLWPKGVDRVSKAA
jgi:hypothetical protein